MAKQIVIPTAYFPPINYFSHLISSTSTHIEYYETYPRHSSRNRANILGANGPMLLSVPINKSSKSLVKDVKIANNDWQKKHIMSIQSAYGSAPFFIHYFEDIKNLINTKYVFLIDLNLHILNYLIQEMDITTNIIKTCSYKQKYPVEFFDFRKKITQKKLPQYQQVFNFNFVTNLSILDVIFNLGPDTKTYLHAK